jgi:hypothetical protein
VTTDSCWSDRTYGSDDDVACYNDCRYEKCEDWLGSSSTLCQCDSHGFCILGCPNNCDSMSDTEKTCHTDCLENMADADECTTWCKTCADTNSCWADATYGDSDDFDCYDECRDEACAAHLGADSSLCDCDQHGFCLLGCP